MKALPPYLDKVIRAVATAQGDDPNFIALCMGLENATFSSYVSQLKRRGLIYRAKFQHNEVWLTKLGKEYITQDK